MNSIFVIDIIVLTFIGFILSLYLITKSYVFIVISGYLVYRRFLYVDKSPVDLRKRSVVMLLRRLPYICFAIDVPIFEELFFRIVPLIVSQKFQLPQLFYIQSILFVIAHLNYNLYGVAKYLKPIWMLICAIVFWKLTQYSYWFGIVAHIVMNTLGYSEEFLRGYESKYWKPSKTKIC